VKTITATEIATKTNRASVFFIEPPSELRVVAGCRLGASAWAKTLGNYFWEEAWEVILLLGAADDRATTVEKQEPNAG
jgi:hypothetical protein